MNIRDETIDQKKLMEFLKCEKGNTWVLSPLAGVPYLEELELKKKAQQASDTYTCCICGETFEKGLEDPISYLHINLMWYNEMLDEQVSQAIEKRGEGDLHALLNSGDTWTVE